MAKSTYKDCYVAFLDILGFKNLVLASDSSEIINIFDTVSTNTELTRAMSKAGDDADIKSYNKAMKSVRFYVMSDSIVVSSEKNLRFALEALIDACIFLQVKLYDLDSPVLLRGAIAEGQYYVNGKVAFGKGLVLAYQYQEAYSIYPRIILNAGMIKNIKDKSYVKEKLHLDENDHYYFIDCLRDYLGGHRADDACCRKIQDLIEYHLNEYCDLQIRQKYMWLKNEYDRVLGKQPVFLSVNE